MRSVLFGKAQETNKKTQSWPMLVRTDRRAWLPAAESAFKIPPKLLRLFRLLFCRWGNVVGSFQ